jgi:hypothetical protein
MQDHGVRRIPLTERGRPVGLVTKTFMGIQANVGWLRPAPHPARRRWLRLLLVATGSRRTSKAGDSLAGHTGTRVPPAGLCGLPDEPESEIVSLARQIAAGT